MRFYKHRGRTKKQCGPCQSKTWSLVQLSTTKYMYSLSSMALSGTSNPFKFGALVRKYLNFVKQTENDVDTRYRKLQRRDSHPAYWNEQTSVDGKRVALIGYGCQSLSYACFLPFLTECYRQWSSNRTQHCRQSFQTVYVVSKQDLYSSSTKPSLLCAWWCQFQM